MKELCETGINISNALRIVSIFPGSVFLHPYSQKINFTDQFLGAWNSFQRTLLSGKHILFFKVHLLAVFDLKNLSGENITFFYIGIKSISSTPFFFCTSSVSVDPAGTQLFTVSQYINGKIAFSRS